MNTATKPKHIGKYQPHQRTKNLWKQEALANTIGISQQSVSNIEGSETVDEKLHAIADFKSLLKRLKFKKKPF
jgi:DNA-binding XRE family transcriptional regulator